MESAPPDSPDLSRLRIQREEEAPQQRRRRRRRRGIPGLGLLIFLAIIAAPGFVFWPKISSFIEKMRALEVECGVVVLTRPTAELELTAASGYVVARVRAALASRHAGRLVELLADVGDKVEADQVVARIEPDTWVHAVAQLEAQHAQGEAEVRAAEVAVEIARKKILRLESDRKEAEAAQREVDAQLAEQQRILKLEDELRGKGAGTADAYESAVNEMKRIQASRERAVARIETLGAEIATGEAEVEGAQARVAVAVGALAAIQARLEAARDDLEDTAVRAPFAGVILLKEAEVGEIVVPALAGGSTSRGAILTMAEFSSLEMEVDVFERDVRLISVGGPTETALDAYPGVAFPGRVRQVVPTADRTKGTVQVKVTFEEIDDRILPEMSGRTTFFREKPAEEALPEVQAPARALAQRDGQDGVFELEGDRARFRPVGIGARQGSLVTISSGLRGGETVVLDPPGGLRDNLPVKVKEQR